MNRLNTVELPPFRAAVDAGVQSVMTAHISVPALENHTIPGTLSKRIVGGLLRDNLNFEGVVVTDAMGMGGISNEYSIVDAAVKAVQAGTDLILVPPDASIAHKGLIAAVRRGDITEDRIDESVRRILKLKQWLGLNVQKYTDVDLLEKTIALPENRKVADEIAARSITLVRNNDNIVPIDPASTPSALVLTVTSDRNADAGSVFRQSSLSQLGSAVSATIDTRTNEQEMEEILQKAESADVIICGMFVQIRARKDYIALNQKQAQFFQQIMALNKPLAVVAFGSPYVLRQFPQIGTYICTYSYTAVSQRAAVQALTGQQPITGRLPVTIPGLHGYGEGIQITGDMTANFRHTGSRILAPSTPYDIGFTRDFRERLYGILEQGVEEKVAPAIVCVVGRRGSIIFNQAAGRTTYDPESTPASIESIFDLASLTKVIVTTTLSMIYYDRGRLKLDEPVSAYLPEMKNGGKFQVRHLLTHSSGLPAFKRFYRDFKGKDEILTEIFKTDLVYKPGTRTVYSDIGMMLMGIILERISGRPLDRLAREEIFEPLGMHNTFFNPAADVLERVIPTEDDPWRGRVIYGEVHDENAFAFGGVAGHAGLFSTGSDLAVLCQMVLNGGTYGATHLIHPEAVRKFTARQNLVPGSSRALGWGMRTEDGSSGLYLSESSVGHTGFTGTSIWIDPERDLFVILLTNRVYPSRSNQKIDEFRKRVHNTIMEMMRK